MMIILTEHDISRLSATCRHELQRLLFERSSEHPSQPEDLFGFEIPSDEYVADPINEPDTMAREGKRVINISTEHAKALIANISPKSLQTLRLFAAGEPIALDALIGPRLPYESLTDLKRSFIGAVTRRLRTVTRNKQAALFLQTTVSPENPAPAISIRSTSAEALRIAMNLTSNVEGA